MWNTVVTIVGFCSVGGAGVEREIFTHHGFLGWSSTQTTKFRNILNYAIYKLILTFRLYNLKVKINYPRWLLNYII